MLRVIHHKLDHSCPNRVLGCRLIPKSLRDEELDSMIPLLDLNPIGYTIGVGCASDAQAVPHFESHPSQLAWNMHPWSPE